MTWPEMLGIVIPLLFSGVAIYYARKSPLQPGEQASRRPLLEVPEIRLGEVEEDEGEPSVEEICSTLGVGRSTLYRYLGGADGGGNRG